jgi:hypothetical protein
LRTQPDPIGRCRLRGGKSCVVRKGR